MEAVASTPRPRPWDVALVALVAAYVVVVVVAVPRGSIAPLTTYAGASPAERIADLSAGFGLIGAGLLAWIELRARRLGLLAILAGIAWFGPDFDGWDRGPGLARSLGAAAAPFVLALVFHLVASFPGGRLRSRLATGAVVAVYGATAVASAGLALFRDPFLDLDCWRNCVDNAFLVHADQDVARVVARGWHYAALAIGLLLVASAARRWHVASRTARRVLWPLLAPGLLVGAAEAAYAVALLRTPLESPTSSGFSSIFLVRALALVALALGLTREVVRTRRTRAAVSRLAVELGEAPPPGKLRESLAGALGDPELDVAYWLLRSQRFVDADGRARSEPVAGQGRAVTPILRAGRPVAVVIHDAATVDGGRLQREIGGAVRLAVENEQLGAEVLAQLADLRASRVRIVELGDAARRRIERDLHDGAQQRMLALSYELRLAHAAAAAADDQDLAATLGSASDEAQATLADLRVLAHGIYPAILSEAGLGPALETLAATAPLAVELADVADERLPAAVESAAYVVVSEAVADAAARHASFVAVTATREADRLVLDLRDDGEARSPGLVHVADRLGALGGTMRLDATSVHVEIPCVVVADDTMLTREGVVRLLREAGVDVVAQAEDAEGLLRHVRLARPDVAIVDIRMPPTHTDEGLVAAETIRAEHPDVGVLVLSQYVEPSYAMRLLSEHLGGVGYLLKERVFDVAVLVDALRRVGEGETVIDPTIVARLVGRRRRVDPLEELTHREREVLGLVAEGLSNRAIAARLFVATRTVEAHTKQVFLKLGLGENADSHRRVLAVLAYLQAGA